MLSKTVVNIGQMSRVISGVERPIKKEDLLAIESTIDEKMFFKQSGSLDPDRLGIMLGRSIVRGSCCYF
jgi:hypothetical protein